MTCFHCGDDQNLVNDERGVICVWCLQHRAEETARERRRVAEAAGYVYRSNR